MHDIKFIRTQPDVFDLALKRRGVEPLSVTILAKDEAHRQAITRLQELQAERNTLAKEFGLCKQKSEDTTALSQRSDDVKKEMATLEAQKNELDNEMQCLLLNIPNMLAPDCPDGTNEEQNVQIRTWGEAKSIANAKQHFEIGEALALMDFERAAKLSGSRFVVLYSDLARLERALANFMLDTHAREFGYEETYVPLLVNDATLFGTGQLPKFRDDQFQTTAGHWLIPTAEVSLTNLVANEILPEEALPLRRMAYTACFRSEAGAAGRDTRGMIRQHQFSKVELVSITMPEQSVAEHERMTTAAETILQRLGLAYRVMALCTGDTGFSAEKTYDLEVWLPGQGAYREISSCSRCNAFQARRMNARYKGKHMDKPQFVHTLNGSGIAVGRALIAVLENYQNADGSVTVPDVLVPYMGGKTKIEKAA
jgi:seryl-tRNA synthetase